MTLPPSPPIIHLVPADVSVRVFSGLCTFRRRPLERSREVSQEAQACVRAETRQPHRNSEGAFHSHEALACTRATLASGFVLSAAAQTPPLPAPALPRLAGPAKIAVIAFQVAVAQTNEGQRNFADLQKKYDPKRQQLKALSDEVDNLTKQLQAQGDKLSDAEQQPAAPRPSTTRRSSCSAKPKTRRTTSSRRCRSCTTAWPPRSMTCSPLRAAARLHAGARRAQQQTPVLYASESTNITKAVIDAYNVKSGVPLRRPDSRAAGSQASRQGAGRPLKLRGYEASQKGPALRGLCCYATFSDNAKSRAIASNAISLPEFRTLSCGKNCGLLPSNHGVNIADFPLAKCILDSGMHDKLFIYHIVINDSCITP